jgi:hypothetical protein
LLDQRCSGTLTPQAFPARSFTAPHAVRRLVTL